MRKSSGNSSALAAQWRAARRLYPIYSALATKYNLPEPPYNDLEQIEAHQEPEAITRIAVWFDELDARIQAHQIRTVLESTDVAKKEDKLHTLAWRYLNKTSRTEADRDKLDYVLARYFSICSPPSFRERAVDLEDVAAVLEPLLGDCSTETPQWLETLEGLIQSTEQCTSLQELHQAKIMERGRQLKVACKEMYFVASALVAFTRFNFLLRRRFYRLVNSDLEAIHAGLAQLRQWGATTLDCTEAGLGPNVPLERVQQLVETWTKPPVAPNYAADRSHHTLMALRRTVDNTLTEHGSLSATNARVVALETKLQSLCDEITGLRAAFADEIAGLRDLIGRHAVRNQAEGAITASPQVPEEVPNSESLLAAASGEIATATNALAAEPAASCIPAAGGLPRTDIIETTIEDIAARLAAGRNKRGGSNIAIGSTVVVLTEPEYAAFFNPMVDPDAEVRRCVAARALLVGAIEESRGNANPESLVEALQCATDQTSRATKQMEVRRQQCDAQQVANLGLALKQLATVVQHSRNLVHQGRQAMNPSVN